MELMDVYNSIQNPLDDEDVIKRLIDAYSRQSERLGGFYGSLTKTTTKENEGYISRDASDKFYAMMFNKWKNSIVALTRDEFRELYRRGSYGANLIKLRKYLKTVPDVSTQKEANDIFYGKTGDKELDEAMDKYRWTAHGEMTGWVHVCSRNMTAKKDEYPNVEHRLYLNTESTDTHELARHFVEKCDERHLPYYFKFDEPGARDDTIVIYSSTENLTQYIEILQELKKEYPDIISRSKEPPALTGKIDGWIGYGSEPARDEKGNHSFNEIRSKSIGPIIDNATRKWVHSHQNMTVTHGGEKMAYTDYLARKCTRNFIDKFERIYLQMEKSLKEKAAKENKPFDPNEVSKREGYTLEEIRSQEFWDKVYKMVKPFVEQSIPKICTKGEKYDTVTVEFSSGKTRKITISDIDKAIEQQAPIIAKHDKTFVPAICDQIKADAKAHGISSEKYCFDVKAIERFKEVSQKKNQDAMQSQTTREPTPQPVVQPTPKKEQTPSGPKENKEQTSPQENQTQEKKDSSPFKETDYLDEFIHGTSIKKPRPRKPNETDMEYVSFLESYYSYYFPMKDGEDITAQYASFVERFLSPEKAAQERKNSPISSNTGTPKQEEKQKSSPTAQEEKEPEKEETSPKEDESSKKDVQPNETKNITAEKKYDLNPQKNTENNQSSPFKESDFSDELIPGTNIKRPRARGIYETDEEYVAFLKMFYDYYFPSQAKKEEAEKETKKQLEDMYNKNYNDYDKKELDGYNDTNDFSR